MGVDLEEGPGVDLVLSDPYELPFPAKSFDVSIATSVFEHNEMFWLTFLELVRVVSDGGLIYLCSPSNGHIHRYPVDCYRFYPDAGFALQNWARRSQYEVTLIESVVLRKDESEWNDWVAVFRVGPCADQPTSPPRLKQKLKPFAIGQGTLSFSSPKLKRLRTKSIYITLGKHSRRSRIPDRTATEPTAADGISGRYRGRIRLSTRLNDKRRRDGYATCED